MNSSGEQTEYSDSVMVKVARLIEDETLKVLQIDQMKSKELKEISTELEFISDPKSKKKSEIALRNELKTIVSYRLHQQKKGKGICHGYYQVNTETSVATFKPKGYNLLMSVVPILMQTILAPFCLEFSLAEIFLLDSNLRIWFCFKEFPHFIFT